MKIQEIVLQESTKDPGKRSRIWKPKEALEILKYKRGIHVVEDIILDLDTLTKNLSLSSDSLARMTHVRFLKIHRGVSHASQQAYKALGWDSGILSGIKGNDNLELIYHLHSAIPSSIWPNRKLSFLSLSSYNKVDKLSNDLGMGSITAPDHYGSMQRNAPELSSLQALTYSQHWTLFIIRTFGAI
ncbi:hypothetical protein JHK82_055341 [Glycine max]|nr:hypothetical protein JHK86_055179 [Glycine max]KAG4917874.1 hypothetical protein JHK85_056155 [Glycine max]KAG5073970.1 hypothetical protein JHK84_055201 [Glycine max]KAG5076646.1 hypothetical protein JHK82_055341 [Glycine max]